MIFSLSSSSSSFNANCGDSCCFAANVGYVGSRRLPVALCAILSRSRTRRGRSSLGMEEKGEDEEQQSRPSKLLFWHLNPSPSCKLCVAMEFF